MRETSLSLIALTVFILTFSVLLGPLLHLPPIVPASITFFLLGLATVDTFQLQGQGAAILADWVAGNSSERRTRILQHEAGHFLAAYLLEIPISGYALNAWEAFRQGQRAQGGVRFADVATDCFAQELAAQLEKGMISAQLAQLMDRYCTVWMAGIAAELLVYGNAAGGGEDRGRIQALWVQLGRPLSEAKQKENWGILQARTLIETHQAAYQALVAAMEKRASVAECYQVIQDVLKVG